MSPFFTTFLIIVILFLINAIRIVKEYERGVIFRLGRLVGARGPGLFIVVPIIEKMIKVDLRTVTLDVPAQEVITKDNVPLKVNAVCYFRIRDPEKSVVQVENYYLATSQIAQTTLRSVLGGVELDELLTDRDKINNELQKIIDEQTDPWGVKVTIVEIKDVELPDSMKRAMARQAEAERERRAKIIAAEGEYQAAQKIKEAAAIIGQEPSAITLRFLQTIVDISGENNKITIFPIPIDLLSSLNELIKKKVQS
ncbi:MAG TPA: slipin family protein [bacterium]|nr:slipin family protein [bacterium]HOL47444.1 slipin family protein [bacterium]HPQ19511.1 slipin family protein [bacterium]